MNILKKDKLIFLPLLLIYILIVLVMSKNILEGDEGRYVMYATNLINGHYSPLDKIYIWNGPGYPIVLMPFVALKLPLLTAKLLNPLFLFAAILYFYNTIRFYLKRRTAVLFTYLLGMYPPFCRFIHMLLTEQLSILLICGIIFHFCKLHNENANSWKQILITSFYLGYLALTKIFYGYVILIALLLWLAYFLWKKGQKTRRTVLVYFFALLFCVPYLLYTYSLTGKIFYWANSGGITLYLMSTNYENGFGDWNLLKKYRNDIYEGLGISTETQIDHRIDTELKARAVDNIKKYPKAYFMNCMANIGRLWFDYPYSFEIQKLTNYFYLMPNMFLFVFFIISFYPAYIGRKLIPFEIYATIIFGLIALTGSSFIFILNRQLWPLVPVLILWISFTLTHFVKIEVNRDDIGSDSACRIELDNN